MSITQPPSSSRVHATGWLYSVGGGLAVWLMTGGLQALVDGQVALVPLALGIVSLGGVWVVIVAWYRRRRIGRYVSRWWFWVTDRLFGVPLRYRSTDKFGSTEWTHYVRLRPNETVLFPSIGHRLPTLLDQGDAPSEQRLHFRVRRAYRLHFEYPPSVAGSSMPLLTTTYPREGGAGYLFSLNPSSHKAADAFVASDIHVTLLRVATLRRGRWRGYLHGKRFNRRVPWKRSERD